MPFFEGDFVKYDYDNVTPRIVLRISDDEMILYRAPTYALFNRILSVLRYSNLLIGVLILYISLFRVKSSLIKSYSIFFLAPSLLCEIYFLMVSAIWDAIEDSDYRISLTYRIISRFLETHFEYHYLVLSNVIIGVTFLIYSNPLFYQKHSRSPKRITLLFVIAWLFVITVSAVSVCFDTLSIDYNFMAFAKEGYVGKLQYFRPCFHVVCGLLMCIFFSASIRALLKDARRRNWRRRLVNVLFYCSPPNVFVFLGIAASVLTVIFRSERNIESENIVVRVEVDQWNRFFLTMRYILASICILLAFSDYRSEVRRFWKRLRCQRGATVNVLFTISQKSKTTIR